MSGQDRPFEPTHVLVVTTSGDAAAEATATAAGISAVLDHVDTVALRLDLDALAADHPELAHRLGTRTDPVDDELRARVDRVRGPLSELLDVTDVHRFVTLERLDVFRDGRRLLHYVPDHAIFEIDASAAGGVAEAVSRAVTDVPAGLLPARVLADWDVDGTHYELHPPSLCVGDGTCFKLSALERVTFDDDDRSIRLTWEHNGGVLATALDLLGPSRPARLQFDSPNRYQDIAAAFETVADALDLETNGQNRP